MKYSLNAAALAAFSSYALAKEMAPNEELAASLYDSGVRHQEIMDIKTAFWDSRRQQGLFDSSQYKSMDAAVDYVPCVGGLAELVEGDPLYTFNCSNIDLYDFKSHADLGSDGGEGAGSWGWTSEDGREFMAVGQSDGAAFMEISAEGKLVYLGRLPQWTEADPSLWREMKGYQSYMVIGSEAVNHGVQFFDMKKLLDVDPASPVVFSNADDIYHFDGLPIGRSHTVQTNEEMGYAIASGAMPRTDKCKSGLIFIDLSDMENLVSPGCASADGYVHDAQCLVYRGPDDKYVGTDICYGYNEDTLTIYNVTDKAAATIISRTSYEGAAYTHQGWVLDTQNQQYLVLDDEYDEYDKVGPGAAGYPITYIWDISSLEAPKQTGYYSGKVKNIDHNQFINGGFAYQSNYGGGLHVLDISSIPDDPTGAGVSKVAHFDIYPEDDNDEGGGEIEFLGTWSNYPYFASGYLIINTIERGVYVVKRTD
ncbi:Uu.00g079570.m01.CDS01 [Anthostomella pinea]|uniref:Uu.00g079570.m01.CDS01 n=1 Tax=Anthostomella pinea TaxID=933095 RepID=A0AAI8VKU3_9PEZI|nr:Uu.00g079570.m01.CDS01 [Anthostomella pinea]